MSITTIQPDATAGLDVLISSGAPTFNQGTDTNLALKNNGINILIEFDLSTIASGDTIDNATLDLNGWLDTLTQDRNWQAKRLKRAWTEGGATWETYDGSNSWQTDGGFGANDVDNAVKDSGTDEILNANGWNVLDVTSIAQDARANRSDICEIWLEMSDGGDEQKLYRSSDYGTASERPKLVVTHTGATGSAQREMPRGFRRGVMRGVT